MYKTPEALQMAVRDAARNSPIETSRAIESFYYHRLLCRIFSRPDSKFVLKGGLGMLARTTDARATRDIDLATEELGIEKAVEELKELASIDLGDFIVFHFDGMEPIRVEDEYRDGYKLFFTPVIGGRALVRISIDLVANVVSYGEPDMLTPADRVDVADLPVFDYPVYPVTSAATKYPGQSFVLLTFFLDWRCRSRIVPGSVPTVTLSLAGNSSKCHSVIH